MELPFLYSGLHGILQASSAIDDQGITVMVIILLILLFLSFSAAGLEIAFYSLTYKDINLLKTKPQQAYKRVIDLLEDPQVLLSSLQIAKVTINISIVALGSYIITGFTNLSYTGWFIVSFIALAVLLLLFCEVMAKLYANHNSVRFAKDFGFVAEALYLVFNRVGMWMVQSEDAVEKMVAGKKNNFNSEEISHAIDKTYPEGKVEEKDILMGILKFGNITVKQVMRTRLDVSGIEYTISFAELLQQVEALHYSRLPVYFENLDRIEGVIHSKDLLPYLGEAPGFDWHILMRKPYFVHEHKLIEELLQEFQQKHIHFAVVVDEFGGTSGIVTLEDILEEIIGDIRDEFDEEEAHYQKIDDNNFIFEGKIMINDVCKVMHLPDETFDKIRGESESLAGLVLEIAGFIPSENETLTAGDFDFTIIEIDKNRLQKVQVGIKPQQKLLK